MSKPRGKNALGEIHAATSCLHKEPKRRESARSCDTFHADVDVWCHHAVEHLHAANSAILKRAAAIERRIPALLRLYSKASPSDQKILSWLIAERINRWVCFR